MKNLIVGLVVLLSSSIANAQFEKLIIVEVDNGGLVKGKTYQFYAQLKRDRDHVHLVFGDEYNQLIIESTEPFFQHDLGGGMSTNINSKIDSLDASLKYDSYFTLGLTNSKNNSLSNFNLDLSDFENKGTGINTNNGAWYVTPDQPQAYVRNGNKHLLFMQLTTTGTITGNLNLQGKDADDVVWRVEDLKFSSEDSISEKEFKKIQKENLKAYKKSKG